MIVSLLEYTARRVGIVPLPSGTSGSLLWSAAYVAGRAPSSSSGSSASASATAAASASAPEASGAKATAIVWSSSSTPTESSRYTQRLATKSFSFSSGIDGSGEVWGRATVQQTVPTASGSLQLRAGASSLFNVTATGDAGAALSGVRVVTDAAGTVTAVVGIANSTQRVRLDHGGGSVVISLKPNEEWAIDGDDATLATATPFVAPHS